MLIISISFLGVIFFLNNKTEVTVLCMFGITVLFTAAKALMILVFNRCSVTTVSSEKV